MELKSYAASTDQGPFLGVNEDHYHIELEKKLFMVFDGFGGAGVGDIAVKELAEDMAKIYGKISGDPDSTLPFFYDPNVIPEGNALINAAIHGHNFLIERNRDKSMGERAGCSGSMIAIGDHLVSLLNCGNLKTVLYGHDGVQDVISESTLKLLGDRSDKRSSLSVPTSGFGLFDKLDYTLREVRVVRGDIIVSMSDGIYSRIRSDEIKSIIEDNNRNLKRSINDLMALSNERGNQDNQTCLLMQF